jgi:hypothetical protein
MSSEDPQNGPDTDEGPGEGRGLDQIRETPAWERAQGIPIERRRDLHDYPNVNGTGLGPREVGGGKVAEAALIVTVEQKVPEEELNSDEIIPEEFEGVQTDVRQIGTLEPQANGPMRQEINRPVAGGVSVGHLDVTAGTASPVMEDSGGNSVILTNRHIVSDSGERDTTGEDFLQPGPSDSDSNNPIGTVKELGTWDTSSSGTNTTDSGVVTVTDARSNGDMSSRFIGAGHLAAWETYNLSDRYVQFGHTTGITSSQISADNYETSIDYGWAVIDYVDQLLFDTVDSDGGDSGSLYGRVDPDTGDVNGIALHFAGASDGTTGVGNKYSNVEAEHGTLTPVSEPGIDTSPIAYAAHFECTIIVSETTADGLAALVCNAGGEWGEKTVTLTSGGSFVDDATVDLEYGDFAVIHFDVTDIATSEGDQEHGFTVETEDDAEAADVYVHSEATYALDVSAADKNDDPIGSATVSVEDTNGTIVEEGTTDSAGNVTIQLPDGDYTVTTNASGYNPYSKDVTINGAAESLSFLLYSDSQPIYVKDSDVNGEGTFDLREGEFTADVLHADYQDAGVNFDVTDTSVTTGVSVTLEEADTGGTDDFQRLSWSRQSGWLGSDESALRGLIARDDPGHRATRHTLRLGHDPDGLHVIHWPLTETGVGTPREEITISDTVNDYNEGYLEGDEEAVALGCESAYAGTTVRFGGEANPGAIVIPSFSGLSWSGAFTIIALVKKRSTQSNQTILRNGFSESGIIFLELRDNARISFGFYDDGGTARFSDTFHEGDAVPGEWLHIVASFQPGSSQLNVWLNGVRETVSIGASRPAPPTGSGNEYSIGQRYSNSDRPFHGWISNVALTSHGAGSADADRYYSVLDGARIDLPSRTT